MRVSVAVPARNEERALGFLLDSLLAQTVPPDEIVLADGGSTDATVAVAGRYGGRGVRVLEIGPAYPGRGRNEAIRAARNEWVALVDAGCVAEPGWLENLLASRDRLGSSVGVVFGDYKPDLATEWDVAQALAFVSPPDPSTGLRPPSIASSLIHRDVWEQVGGFPEHLRAAEDLLFIQRLEAARVPIARSPGAVVRWRLAPGPAAVFRRFRLYSAHHLAAGLFGSWHARVMAMDGAALLLGTVGVVWSPSLLALAVGAIARIARSASRRRGNIGDRMPFRPDRLFRVALLLLLADVATWVGVLDYALGREPSR